VIVIEAEKHGRDTHVGGAGFVAVVAHLTVGSFKPERPLHEVVARFRLAVCVQDVLLRHSAPPASWVVQTSAVPTMVSVSWGAQATEQPSGEGVDGEVFEFAFFVDDEPFVRIEAHRLDVAADEALEFLQRETVAGAWGDEDRRSIDGEQGRHR